MTMIKAFKKLLLPYFNIATQQKVNLDWRVVTSKLAHQPLLAVLLLNEEPKN